MASRERSSKRRRDLPAWFVGAIIGDAFWGLALFGAYLFETHEQRFPDWFLQRDLADILGSICGVIAAPIPLGGWLLIWGDRGPPFAWFESLPFNIGFGLCFYASLGAIVGRLISRRFGRRC
jgi:hypothetical protein